MSKISDILDKLKADMVTLFPDHNQMTNPYNVGANTELSLRQAWGIAVGPAENTRRNISCKLSVNRVIIIKFARKFYATDLNIDAKEDTEKLLLEDQFKVIDFYESEPALGGLVIKSDYVSDGGIERVYADKDQNLKLESIFTFEYAEDLN